MTTSHNHDAIVPRVTSLLHNLPQGRSIIITRDAVTGRFKIATAAQEHVRIDKRVDKPA